MLASPVTLFELLWGETLWAGMKALFGVVRPHRRALVGWCTGTIRRLGRRADHLFGFALLCSLRAARYVLRAGL